MEWKTKMASVSVLAISTIEMAEQCMHKALAPMSYTSSGCKLSGEDHACMHVLHLHAHVKSWPHSVLSTLFEVCGM